MNDCLQWFVTKHWVLAILLFPELCFVWALWMRWFWWAAFIILLLGGKNYQTNTRKSS